MARQYYVYILANRPNGVLYTGVTNDLKRRVFEHKQGLGSAFTRRYNVTRLVFYQVASTALEAIAREKQIKGGSRERKVELIETGNPEWRDLYFEI